MSNIALLADRRLVRNFEAETPVDLIRRYAELTRCRLDFEVKARGSAAPLAAPLLDFQRSQSDLQVDKTG